MRDAHDQPRALRRHVRVDCTIHVGTHSFAAFSTNLSVTGMFVRLPLRARELLKIGEPVGLEFQLPSETGTLATSAELVWINPDDRDASGMPVIGVGMRLVEPAPEVVARVGTFIREFRYTVLAVDDDESVLDLLERLLSAEYRVLRCNSAGAALEVLEQEEVAVLVIDHFLPDMSGPEFLAKLIERLPYSRVVRIVISGTTELDHLQQLINVGNIFHYIRKPFLVADLLHVVQRAVETYALLVENERLNTDLTRANDRLKRENEHLRRYVLRDGFRPLVGTSPQLQVILDQIRRVCHSDVPVHICGETGTGKELIARALHDEGPRANRAFIAQNCASMTDTLLQSTLFGHRRGAFTGADRDHPGVFREANGGTLFLDEIAELSLAIQGSLLRALQDGEIMPVGGSRPIQVDVRIISATNRDLREEVKAGRFREDLFFRIMVIAIDLPPLRERTGDIPLLARHFLEHWCRRSKKNIPGFTPEAMATLEAYAWPGNVRELEHEIERLVVLAEPGEKIPVELLSTHLRDEAVGEHSPALAAAAGGGVFVPFGLSYDAARRQLEQALIDHALDASSGVLSRAAEMLGMDRSRLSKMRKRL